ncbi:MULTISPECIES: hypothetical protein [unclassified Blautia]|uniref:hypothetical protein n=1 Tax=unclassified Blautia TaxID=2648079 RepID=UPI003F8B8C93
MAYYDISENVIFNEKIRKLEVTDRAHADVFNYVFQQIISNQFCERKERQLLETQLSERIQGSLEVAGAVDARLVVLKENVLQIAMVVQAMTDAKVLDSDNVAVDLFDTADDIVLICGSYDAANKRLYA